MDRRWVAQLLLATCLPLSGSCGAPETPREERQVTAPGTAPATLQFRDVAEVVGLTFRYSFGDFTYDNILESSGSGVTWLDVDGDRDLDLYLLQGAYLEGVSDPKGAVRNGWTNRLYCNVDGTFRDCTEESGLADPSWSMAAAAADYDGDGRVDVFVSNYGANHLFRGFGEGRFTDVTEEAGLAGPGTLNGFTKWSVGGTWFDFDRDGDLDLLVCNFLAFDPLLVLPGREWEMPEPAEYRGQASHLYEQLGDGRFRNVTDSAGLLRPNSKCMGTTVADWDDDGWLDIFQGNDHQANFLFRSRGDGSFEELALSTGVAVNDEGRGTGSMHGTPGDVDGDGDIDILVTDLRHGSLYLQREPMLFEDATWASGIAGLLEGHGQWGAGLQDFDLDGDLDLFTTNGVAHVLELQRPVLAVNDGEGRFRSVRDEAGPYFAGKRSGRAAAFADFDNDGDVDIAVNHVDLDGRVALLENITERAGHWIGFWLEGTTPRDAYGATVRVEAGGRHLVRVHHPVVSYLSGSDPRVHFGLGPASLVARTRVRWPDGTMQEWKDLSADRYWILRQGESAAEPATTAPHPGDAG